MNSLRERVLELALQYDEARQARIDTKRALLAFRAEQGFCDGDEENSSCFRSGKPVVQWCELCQESHPLWAAYRSAARSRANTHRRLLTAIRALRDGIA